jgi:hypothetical protein
MPFPFRSVYMQRRLIPAPNAILTWCHGAHNDCPPSCGHTERCYTVSVREGGRRMIYHDYMERWEPKPWWRKVWDYVRKRSRKKRTL